MNLEKMKPWRNKKYLQWVRKQKCFVTGQPAEVAHHIINCNMGGTMGSKQSDIFTLPMTTLAHQQLHHNPKKYETEYDQKKLTLQMIEKALNDGVLNMGDPDSYE